MKTKIIEFFNKVKTYIIDNKKKLIIIAAAVIALLAIGYFFTGESQVTKADMFLAIAFLIFIKLSDINDNLKLIAKK